MSPLDAIVLGIVEGVTEFLPISSTGHLIVAADLLGADTGGTFEIVVQLGAVLAVAWFYRRDLLARLAALARGQGLRFWSNLLVAVAPAATLGFVFGDAIKAVLFRPTVVAASLIAGGIVLWAIETARAGSSARGRAEAPPGTENPEALPRLEDISGSQALAVGLAQVFALVPGVSRAASSIVGGLLAGLDRPTATAFSFYLSIPTLGGATLYDLIRNLGELRASGEIGSLLLAIAVAFVTALLAIGWLLRFVARHDFRGFAVYRVIAGLAILGWVALRGPA